MVSRRLLLGEKLLMIRGPAKLPDAGKLDQGYGEVTVAAQLIKR